LEDGKHDESYVGVDENGSPEMNLITCWLLSLVKEADAAAATILNAKK
jgi:hypothetical protein